MKKFIVIMLFAIFAFCSYTQARTVYDSTGRHIIYDDTIRGHKKAAALKAEQQKKLQAAAAAKLNYEEALKTLEEPKPKTNFYQDRIKSY